ncbi:hypothetical protein ABZS99_44070 [Streptomyces sp. NPDC005463]|uniref:hypothetical protein n=1 Tax=Streptomyces sp. NPDC005463 TaxID=3154465 RepID=UPI0033B317C9
MKFADWAPILVAFITVTGGIVQARRKRPMTREIVKQDAELLALLPEDSEAKQILAAHIDGAVREIVEGEDEQTRDLGGVLFWISFLVLAVFLVVVAVDRGGYWWLLCLPAAVAWLLGAPAVVQDVALRRRDARGRPV